MKYSGGFLVYRRGKSGVEILLLRLGGPFWAKKDGWHFPKGELEPGEDALTAAKREFAEEVGTELPDGELLDLGEAKQGDKTNHIWALEADVDLSQFPSTLKTNVFPLEWPPKSGNIKQFPENDRAEWFDLATVRQKLLPKLHVFVERLAERIDLDIPEPPEQQSLL